MKKMPDIKMMKALGEIKDEEGDEDNGIFDNLMDMLSKDEQEKSVTEYFDN